MRILIAHNHYRTSSGGEDVVFATERELLRARGHEVTEYTVSNTDIRVPSLPRVATGAIWNRQAYREVFELVSRLRIEVAHFHNTQPLLSPAVYYAARRAGARVIQTLHNYRLLCPRADLYREGAACEDCAHHRVPWPGMWRGCYRSSRAATAVAGCTVALHRALGTWTRKVDAYIVMTSFARDKFAAWGLPADRLVVKPNFIHPAPRPGEGGGGYALYAGRLSEEKGISALLAAYTAQAPSIPLKIAGSGPLEPQVRAAACITNAVEYVGWQSRDRILELMRSAAVVVVPSLCYEGFPITVIEAFGTGTPVLASRTGPLAEIVDAGRTGLFTLPGDVAGLRSTLDWVAGHPTEMYLMRHEARAEFVAKYTAERNYQLLMEAYERVTGSRRLSRAAGLGAASGPGHARGWDELPGRSQASD